MINYLEWTTDGQCSQTHIEQTNVPAHLQIIEQVIFPVHTFKLFGLPINYYIKKKYKSELNYNLSTRLKDKIINWIIRTENTHVDKQYFRVEKLPQIVI